MSDLTPRYRISLDENRDNVDITEYWVSDHEGRDAGWLVPDSTLQQIADAWNNGNNLVGSEAAKRLVELLDGLVNE